MSDRELLTECLDVLTHDAAQRTFAGGVRMSQLSIKLRAALAAPRPEPVAWMRKEWSPDCGSYFDFCAEEEMGWRDRKEWTPLYADPPAAAQEPEKERAEVAAPARSGVAQTEEIDSFTPEVYPEHTTDGTPCWCSPELDYVDPDTGVEVWIHRRAQ